MPPFGSKYVLLRCALHKPQLEVRESPKETLRKSAQKKFNTETLILSSAENFCVISRWGRDMPLHLFGKRATVPP